MFNLWSDIELVHGTVSECDGRGLGQAGGEAGEDQKQKTGEAEEDVKPFICDICPKTFKLSNQLRLHKEFNHSQDRPLTCNFCFRQFKQFDALQKHRQMHTEN